MIHRRFIQIIRLLAILLSFHGACSSSILRASDLDAAQRVRPGDTSSPRATIKSFIESCNAIYDAIRNERYLDRSLPKHRPLARKVIDCIDNSQLPEFARRDLTAEAATCIKEILDRVELPSYEEIPDVEAIEQMAGGLDRWQIPGTRLVIVRVPEGPRKHEYLFSPGTVTRSFDYYQDVKDLPYRTGGPTTSPRLHQWYVTAPESPAVGRLVDAMPEWMRFRAFGLAYWKWGGLTLVTTAFLAVLILLYRLQSILANRYRLRRPVMYCLTIVFPLLAAATPMMFRYATSHYVSLRGSWFYAMSFGANVIGLFTMIVLVFSVINRIAVMIIASPRINPQGLDAQFIRIVSKMLSLTVSVIVFLEGGQYLGIPINTLLASAGVGGLAVALAAQDTLKNLFGTIMLMADKPFRIGERIVFGQYDGVVEEIGLRSTRVRLLNGHQVTIPNDTLSRNDIENIGRRPYIRRVANLHVPKKTPREKIEQAIKAIRQALDNHEGMNPELPPRVYFDEFNADSFNLRILYWYHPPDYWRYLAFTERLNLQIVRALEEAGVELTAPLRFAHAGGGEEPLQVKILGEDSI